MTTATALCLLLGQTAGPPSVPRGILVGTIDTTLGTLRLRAGQSTEAARQSFEKLVALRRIGG